MTLGFCLLLISAGCYTNISASPLPTPDLCHHQRSFLAFLQCPEEKNPFYVFHQHKPQVIWDFETSRRILTSVIYLKKTKLIFLCEWYFWSLKWKMKSESHMYHLQLCVWGRLFFLSLKILSLKIHHIDVPCFSLKSRAAWSLFISSLRQNSGMSLIICGLGLSVLPHKGSFIFISSGLCSSYFLALPVVNLFISSWIICCN